MALTSRDAHSLDTTDFTIFPQSEGRILPSIYSRTELARARPIVQPWPTVSLVLTDDKLHAWDKLGIGYAAHVSFRVPVSFRIHTASYLLPSRIWIADLRMIFCLPGTRHH